LAGAVIIGKANLSEWANFRDSDSSSGWSSLGGQTRNPYVLDRNPCGSSSGSAVAVAARMTPLAVGTETNGSIVCPAGVNGVVGIKPTVGLVSRSGIIPVSHTQDTAGPMALSVAGAALLLQAMVDFDPSDPKSVRFSPDRQTLLPDSSNTDLTGRRIGVLRTYLGAGAHPQIETIYQQAVERLQVLGATLIDPIEYLSTPAMRGAAYRVLLHEFKSGLNAYLTAHGAPRNLASLADVIAFNQDHPDQTMSIFGQSIFLEAESTSGLDSTDYQQALAASQQQLRQDVDALFARHQLDALFLPVNGPAWKTDWGKGDDYDFGGTAYLAAITGYPSIVLPAGEVGGLPVAVGFVGLAQTDAELIQMAYALEQSLPPVSPPMHLPTLEDPPGDD
jgi:amidase